MEMMKTLKEEMLEKLKFFDDPKFLFEEKEHVYTYEGECFTSVTTFIQQFHKPFDKEYWSKKKADEQGVPQEWILNEWQKKNDIANEIGTATHLWIENYFNNIWSELPTNTEIINRINKFNSIYASYLYKLEPLSFEKMVFSKKWKIAGMIDSLFLYGGNVYILDWKTNKEFSTDKTLKYKERLLAPFNDFYKSKLSEYSIQLSLYALILEDCGINVKSGYLVHIGPGDEPATIHKIIDMRDILRGYLN